MIVRPPRQRIVWLVRHGETDWNAAGRVQGHDDRARLTPRGEHQAQRAAALLANKDVECVYSSDLTRAQQTATLIAASTGALVVTDRRLRERGLGRLEGMPTASLRSSVTGITDGRVTDVDCHPVGGESLDHLYRRCAGFVAWLRSLGSGPDIVVVAHGGSIRMLRAAWTDRGPEHLAWTPVVNAAVLRLVLPAPAPRHGSEGGPTLLSTSLFASLQSSAAPLPSAVSPAATPTPSTLGRPL